MRETGSEVPSNVANTRFHGEPIRNSPSDNTTKRVTNTLVDMVLDIVADDAFIARLKEITWNDRFDLNTKSGDVLLGERIT